MAKRAIYPEPLHWTDPVLAVLMVGDGVMQSVQAGFRYTSHVLMAHALWATERRERREEIDRFEVEAGVQINHMTKG